MGEDTLIAPLSTVIMVPATSNFFHAVVFVWRPNQAFISTRNLIRYVRMGHHGTLEPPNCSFCFSVALESAAGDDGRWIRFINQLLWVRINLAFRLISVVPAKYQYLAPVSLQSGWEQDAASHNSSESARASGVRFRV
jgi:hypothetical protein